ncbi:MAG: DUF5916 domain-containing protein [Gemmatimonadaceae bacterium]
MITVTLALLLLSVTAQSGADSLVISIPRLDEQITVDAKLSEPAWERSARLTRFSQFQPVDGRPAEERTDVLVWYSATAIHFGVVAYSRNPESIRATLSDRDNIESDDRVTIYLDTFLDRRRAFFFVVNPLGVQADGVRTEGAVSAGRIFGGNVDLSPDYLFDSKGAVTDSGYVLEIRIPFESLRFPTTSPQRWGLQVVRNVASTGYEDTWTAVKRAGASFLAQAGTIEGMVDVKHGIVFEAQPFVTASMTGSQDPLTESFNRESADPDAGLNLRLGLPQVSLDATINPDFSQVESDVGLVTVNERFALFLPEKRPFFLEGIELFATPNQLVYTRRIVNPLVGGKVTGKLGRLGVAHLTALDETVGRDALFNVSRLRTDFGENSIGGLTLTDRRRGSAFNTVAAADARVIFARLYYVEGQLGGSWTRRAGDDSISGGGDGTTLTTTRSAPVWKAEFDRTGRSWGFNYNITGLGDEFESDAGFVPRSGIVRAHAFNRFTRYGSRGALVENFTMFLGPSRLWSYDDFSRNGALEGNELVGGFITLRGGWNVNYGLFRQFVIFDDALFAGVETENRAGVRAPYDPPRKLTNLFGDSVSVSTPRWERVNAFASFARLATPIFFEGAEGTETRIAAGATLRPSIGIRVEALGVLSNISRERDGSLFAQTLIPRLKIEYQPIRSLFFRVVSEYRMERPSTLVSAETGDLLVRGGVRQFRDGFDGLRSDWLISYEPTPGTVAFFGYGSSLEAPSQWNFSALERKSDGFFVKLAYQFRR